MILEGYKYTHYRQGREEVYENKYSKGPQYLYSNSTNPFDKLPIELEKMILFELTSKHVGSICLRSRAFSQLSQNSSDIYS